MKKCLFIIFILFNSNVFAANDQAIFKAGRAAYDQKDYASAIVALEKAVELAPGNSEYHRWLGRAFGKKASQASWYKAMGLAKQAQVNFEKAVELDPQSIYALSDLMHYYIEAPTFLGGGQDKVAKIIKQIEALGYTVEGDNIYPSDEKPTP